MEYLKALILQSAHTPYDLQNDAFEAPGWRSCIIIQSDFHDTIAKIGDISQYDWIIIEAEYNQTSESCVSNRLYDWILNNRHSKNYGILLASLNQTVTDSGIRLRFWKTCAQCLYSAHFAPESVPQPILDIYDYYNFKGDLVFQKPLFAKSAALFLANLSHDPGRVNLGLWEMFINSIEHGNLGISHTQKRDYVMNNNIDELIQERLSSPHYANRFVKVYFVMDINLALFDIRDDGDGFDWLQYLQIDNTRLSDKNGRGIALTKLAGFDEMSYQGSGNHVICTSYFSCHKCLESR